LSQNPGADQNLGGTEKPCFSKKLGGLKNSVSHWSLPLTALEIAMKTAHLMSSSKTRIGSYLVLKLYILSKYLKKFYLVIYKFGHRSF